MSLHHSPEKKYMVHFEKYNDTNIVFGEGAFDQLGTELLLERCGSVCFVFGGMKTAMANGTYRDFVSLTSRLRIENRAVYDIPPEPDTDDVRRIVSAFEEEQPQFIVAVGGGSVMDAAKAACLSWQTGLDVTELFGVDVSARKFPGKTFRRVICVPTTAGTGSEVTPYSNIVDREKNVKCLIMDRQIVPSIALVDPTFCATMPESLTVTTALDALVHSLESFLNLRTKNAPEESGEWALEAVRLIVYALPRVLEDPSAPLEREMLSAAALLGGMCIKARPTSLPHLCSFSLYGKVPHGRAVAAFLPPFWRYYLGENAIREQTMRLAGIFGPSAQNTPEGIVDSCEAFIRRFTPPMPLTPEEIRKIAADALKNPVKLESAPRRIAPEEAERVISNILSKAFSA